ncbi:MAG: hypothetical protein N3H30_01255 [Candidatus Micrarchaeota archaeon]|nr:hypothetical protein [Candidatus Micrarchaeota archaeon]
MQERELMTRPFKAKKKVSTSGGVRKVFASAVCKPFDEEPLSEVSAKALKRGDLEAVIRINSISKDGTIKTKKGTIHELHSAGLEEAEFFVAALMLGMVDRQEFEKICAQRYVPSIEQAIYLESSGGNISFGLKNVYKNGEKRIVISGTHYEGKDREEYVIKTLLNNGSCLRRDIIIDRNIPRTNINTRNGHDYSKLSIDEISMLLATRKEITHDIPDA